MSEKFPVWILLKKAEVEGQWIGHCLELDVVSQGDGAKHAYEMAVEAAKLAMQWDLEEDLDPRQRPQAPADCYDDLHFLIDRGSRMEVDEALDDGGFSVIAVRVSFDLDKLRAGDDQPYSPPPEPVMRALAQAA